MAQTSRFAALLATAGFFLLISVLLSVWKFPDLEHEDLITQIGVAAILGVAAFVGASTILAAGFSVLELRGDRDHAPGLWSAFTIIAAGGLLGSLIALQSALTGRPAEVEIGMVVILGVSAVMVLLFVMASGFAALKLADKGEALALPKGSIRALIALFLIIMFVIMGIYFFSRIEADEGPTGEFSGLTKEEIADLDFAVTRIEPSGQTGDPPETTFDGAFQRGLSAETKQIGQQVITILGTMATAVVAFYFGTAKVTAAREAVGGVIRRIDEVSPAKGGKGESVTLRIKGVDLQGTAGALLKMDGDPPVIIEGTHVSANFSLVKAVFKLGGAEGVYDVVVKSKAGESTLLPDAFEITKPPPPEEESLSAPVASISTIDPSSGPPLGLIPLKITGSGLSSATTVHLVSGDLSQAQADAANATDTSVECTMQLPEAGGPWDVVVKAGDSELARLPGAFVLEQPQA